MQKTFFMFFSLFSSLANSITYQKNVKKWIHITKYQVLKKLGKVFFFGSDNFIIIWEPSIIRRINKIY